ncbi:hypothetical protein SDC9_87567 [bioreactor metagenome]|uniref:Uncharacterized protein n=1 Tax=bioreactor metagenome TaxID=1076179 RepID=A0A644ZKQ3_9ZZZZ
MELQHVGVVHLVDMVTGQYQHVFRIVSIDIGDILVDGMRSSLEPLFAICTRIRLQNSYATVSAGQSPRLSIADVFIQFQWLILRHYPDLIDA